MAPQNTMLSNVVGKHLKKACFTVRVVRLWTVPRRHEPETPRLLEMVLQDGDGTRIQATADQLELINRFRDSIDEHGVYVFKNYKVNPNSGGWRPTTHAFRFFFTDTTIVSENVAGEYPDFPMKLYKFLTVHEVLQTPPTNDQPDLIDFIGALVQTESVYPREAMGSNFLSFHLRDLGNERISVTLWGEYGDQARAALYRRRNATVVVLLQLCRISRKKDGSLGLATFFHVTKVLIDEHIPDVEEFRYRFMVVSEPSAQHCGPISASSGCSGPIGPVISDISKLLCAKEGKGYWFYGTISSLLSKEGWCYQACPDAKCSKKVESIGDEYQCTNYKKKTSNPIMRYRVKVDVKDRTASLVAMLWDELCRGLFGEAADELARQSNEKDDGSSTIPKEIEDCQGKSYLFKVSGYQGSGSSRVYNIAMLCSDPDVINEHKPAHEDSSSSESDSDDDLDVVIRKTNAVNSNVFVEGVVDVDEDPAITPSSKRRSDENDDGADDASNTRGSTNKKLKNVKKEK